MTIEEVASYLKVSERTVYEWAQKDLPGENWYNMAIQEF